MEVAEITVAWESVVLSKAEELGHIEVEAPP